MTSKSSSWTNMQKVMFKQRSWVFAVTFLTYAIMHIAIPAMILSNRRNNWQMYSDAGSPLSMEESIRQAVLMMLDHRGLLVLETIPLILIAVLLAFQGFAWLNNKRQIDFYESQPISRNRHFLQVVFSSFMIFLGSYLVTTAIGGLIVMSMGGYSTEVLVEAVKLCVKVLYLFAGYFGLSMLAGMLTGNTVVGLLAAAVFFLYEPALRLMVISLRQMYYQTYVLNSTLQHAWTSPFFWVFVQDRYHWIKGILLLVLIYASTFACYKIRRNENAGEAVLYKPVRILAKIAVSMIIGFFVMGVLCRTSGNSLTSSVISGMIAAVVIGCIMESIYAFDVRAALRGFGWTLIGAVAAAALFVTIAKDLTGYDRWIPDQDQVESAYIIDPMYAYRAASDDYAREYMHLTDIEKVNELLKVGETFARGEISEEEVTDTDDYTVVRLELHYRMKNGQDIARNIQVSNVTEKELVNSIIGSQEFKEGYFQIYHNELVEENLDKMKISGYLVNSEYEETPAQKVYNELKTAYEKDLETFDWTTAMGSRIIGEFALAPQDRYASQIGDHFWPEYVVYESFENTIAVLQKAGIYPEKIDVDKESEYGAWIQGPFGMEASALGD